MPDAGDYFGSVVHLLDRSDLYCSNHAVPGRIVIAVFPELRPYGFGLVRGLITELW